MPRVRVGRGSILSHTEREDSMSPDEHRVAWYRWDELPKEQVSAHLSRRLITGDRMMLAHVYIQKGCVVPRHAHENEQLTYILEGALQFLIGADGRSEEHTSELQSRLHL